MKAPIVVTAIALALGGLSLAWAERAQPREGGASREGNSGGGAVARQPSGGGGSSAGSHVSGGRSDSSSERSAAERRHPRPGTGTGGRGHDHRPYVRYWYSPGNYGYYGFYDWWYGPGWYGGYYGHYPAYAYGRHSYNDHGALRLQVRPKTARVYIDGYYAGVVDDFDGVFQRLNVAPGRHELSFKLEGYKTHRVRLFVPPDQTLKVRHDLARGDGEDTTDDSLDKPGLEWAEHERERSRRERYGERERERARDAEREVERDEPTADADDAPGDAGAGTLSLAVSPEQAAVYVDGTFRGTGRDVNELNLPPGRHRVEVVAPGFRTFDSEIDVNAGAPNELKIVLERP